MKILLASSEIHPFSKTGGLADMVGALGKTLAKAGHEVGIVTPLYLGIREKLPGLKLLEFHLDFPLGNRRAQGEVWSCTLESGAEIYFIDQPEFYQRAGLYQQYGVDWPDNPERFTFFCKAITHLALHLPWKPELVHLNDWQTGLAALFLHHQRQLPAWKNAPPVCFTIHNLAYQGVFPVSRYALLNLPWDYFTHDGLEFFGQINFLKAGIAFSDAITTVSPRYAREITTEEYGCGLDGFLRRRTNVLTGILNGVDYDEWNTHHNPYLARSYGNDDLKGKETDKLELLKEFGLPPDPSVPLFGNIGRLAEQKGVDILIPAVRELAAERLNVVLLGNGSAKYERAYQDLSARFPRQVSTRIGFDPGLSHRVEAGCDFFLMPSRFEPCGLNQMYSLRYGTVPIVRITGGLDDSVIDIRENPLNANGIKFAEYSSSALSKAMRKGLALYDQPELLAKFRYNGMTADFSWNRTAERYIEVYQAALNTRAR
jgi:starch synthase